MFKPHHGERPILLSEAHGGLVLGFRVAYSMFRGKRDGGVLAFARANQMIRAFEHLEMTNTRVEQNMIVTVCRMNGSNIMAWNDSVSLRVALSGNNCVPQFLAVSRFLCPRYHAAGSA